MKASRELREIRASVIDHAANSCWRAAICDHTVKSAHVLPHTSRARYGKPIQEGVPWDAAKPEGHAAPPYEC